MTHSASRIKLSPRCNMLLNISVIINKHAASGLTYTSPSISPTFVLLKFSWKYRHFWLINALIGIVQTSFVRWFNDKLIAWSETTVFPDDACALKKTDWLRSSRNASFFLMHPIQMEKSVLDLVKLHQHFYLECG